MGRGELVTKLYKKARFSKINSYKCLLSVLWYKHINFCTLTAKNLVVAKSASSLIDDMKQLSLPLTELPRSLSEFSDEYLGKCVPLCETREGAKKRHRSSKPGRKTDLKARTKARYEELFLTS